MFAERLTTVTETHLKGSDGKKLRRRLRDQYPLLSDMQMARIWPLSSLCTVRKLPKRVNLYTVGKTPLFYTADSDELRPTLYLLHCAPQLMEQVVIHDGVGAKVIGGADLFMPGVVITEAPAGKSWVAQTFGARFSKGDFRAIREESCWAPIAVARWRVASDELEMQGMQGRALDIIHTIDDELWKCGSRVVPEAEPESAAAAVEEYHQKAADAETAAIEEQEQKRQTAQANDNASFVEDAPRLLKRKQKALRQLLDLKEKVATGAVVPDAAQRAKLYREVDLAEEIVAIESRLDTILNPPPPPDPPTDEASASAAAEGGGDDADDHDGASAASPQIATDADAESNEGGAGADVDDEDEDRAPEQTMDEQLHKAALLALTDSLEPSDLPILASTFTAKHLHPASRRVNPSRSLNVKQTQYKKMAKFLLDLQDAGVLKVATEKAGVEYITVVDWKHELLSTIDPRDYPDEPDPAGDAGDLGQKWNGQLPKRGTKRVEIVQKKKKGNKNVTVVSSLENFGFELDENLKRTIAKHFSASVNYDDGPDATKGKLIFVQGKYVMQLAKYIETQLGVPGQYIVVNAKGVSSRDKAINV